MDTDRETYFKSHGKLLLTGEYLVLKGAKALGLRANFAQNFSVKDNKSTKGQIHWLAKNIKGEIWYEGNFHIEDGKVLPSEESQNDISLKLAKALQFVNDKTDCFSNQSFNFTSEVEFPREWGLGTSSTMLANLSKWSSVDPFELLKNTFGGSGYDVAVAMTNRHILYTLNQDERNIETVSFSPAFKEHIFFVYLNEKRDSQNAVASFKKYAESEKVIEAIAEINEITKLVSETNSLKEFEDALKRHERILSDILNEVPVKERLFSDYTGGICKSLGAWGGDFIMVTGKKEDLKYFSNKGYNTILSFKEMICE
ncbi:MAG: GYDIA family GHMP kinase [Crocinitomicaceae bacterium]|nr:GYDIA family GHMP kinase [Crocinitomicaceae bacterium]